MRVMAVDYGDVRTGLAVSDATGSLVGEAFVVKETSAGKLADIIAAEAAARRAACLVVGLPKNMDGTRGERAQKSERLAEALRAKTALPVFLWDERRTTAEAQRILHGVGRSGRRGREKIDAVAAALILEGFLLSRRTAPPPEEGAPP
ncbi:MAG: Holliday junction resolvase RuvX [Oscillospiraceae bacterium]|jgi:putative Holliday junction resolvase|nr:Holliday junction resolvase RuvX [Oscillospiraceae bacterium]